MDTTAHTLSFTIYALAANPTVQTRAQQEVDAFTASPHDEGTLPAYMEAVLKESMRRYPTAATGSVRQVRPAEGYDLSEQIHLPQNWWVFVNIYSLHNSKAIWGEDVDQFRPERWLDLNAGSSKSRSGDDEDADVDPLDADGAYAKRMSATANNPLASPAAYAGVGLNSDELCYCPFAYGPRNCVGMNLSLMEMRATLLALVSSYHFELADESMRDEKKMIAPTTFTMRPAGGLPIKITKRK
jgi:cytochrome P450